MQEQVDGRVVLFLCKCQGNQHRLVEFREFTAAHGAVLGSDQVKSHTDSESESGKE